MGWCGGTSIFDAAIEAALPFISPGPDLDAYVEKIADALWEGDWDCEGDSQYYTELLEPLMLKRGYIDEDEFD